MHETGTATITASDIAPDRLHPGFPESRPAHAR